MSEAKEKDDERDNQQEFAPGYQPVGLMLMGGCWSPSLSVHAAGEAGGGVAIVCEDISGTPSRCGGFCHEHHEQRRKEGNEDQQEVGELMWEQEPQTMPSRSSM